MDTSPSMPPVAPRKSLPTLFIGIGVVVVLLGVCVWWFTKDNTMFPGGDDTAKAVRIMYTENGFEPKEVTVKQGQTVTFLQGTVDAEMWVASDDHPEHAGYAGTPMKEHCPDASGLRFDQCAKGVSYSFTFQKTGTWGYHNHEHPEAKGVITVTQ